MHFDPKLVSVRDFTMEDVPAVMDYWFHSAPGFIEGLGVDPKKMPDEETYEAGFRLRISNHRKTGKAQGLAIAYDGKVIGMHTINPLVPGESGVFHAHIFDWSFRGKGVGMISYPKACAVFFERFNLKKIQFKTPVQNRSAIRVKEKLGIPCVGEEMIGFGIIKDHTRALCYELTPELMLKIRR